jgi:hypothetical protein
MSKEVVSGLDIKYSIVYLDAKYLQSLKTLEKKPHEIIGYGIMKDVYTFYSIEDNYSHPIVNHWTETIIGGYHKHMCWILVKEHPCHLYRIMVNILKPSNYVFEIHNFDIWKTEARDCLVAVVTELTFD